MDVIYSWPTWLMTAALLALMFAANEAGFLAGRWRSDSEPEASRTVANALKASIFGLVAFLLAFAFSMTSGRHDARRRVVLDEANAIGTCYLRAEILGEPQGARIRDILRQFVGVRLEYFEKALNEADHRRTTEEMGRLLDELWTQVAQTTRSNPEIAHASQIVPAANEVIDLHSTRAWTARSHLQPTVLMLLVVCVLVSNLLIGHSSGQTRRRHAWLWTAFNVLFALVLFVVMDFDRPRRGLIQVDHTPLIELKAEFARDAATQEP